MRADSTSGFVREGEQIVPDGADGARGGFEDHQNVNSVCWAGASDTEPVRWGAGRSDNLVHAPGKGYIGEIVDNPWKKGFRVHFERFDVRRERW
jgi:hypothetical protein